MDTRVAPLLPLRDIIVFPHQVVPLFVGREKSIAAVEEAMAHTKEIVLAAQKSARTNDPSADDIYEVGTLAAIIQLLRLPDDTVKVLVEGRTTARIQRHLSSDAFFKVEFEPLDTQDGNDVELQALMRSVQGVFESYVKLNKRIPPETLSVVSGIDDPSKLSYTIACYLTLNPSDKQGLLEEADVARRLERLHSLMQSEIEILQVEKKIRSRVKKQMERTQKEYYLNEQMQAIQKELGERDEFKNELAELEEKIAEKKLSEEAETRVRAEIKKLKMMSPMSAEATVVRHYIDWILALPWNETVEENLDLDHAQEVLDADHHGLTKVKERILEHLAVQNLIERPKGPILCMVGPPGVGKTSLARSIAKATGRPFVRISLGGVRDEAEIRGHRRTYIGALPGRIVQNLKKAGASNPVILLDEVDKMSTDFRGDPSAALLEVLDPEQNQNFNDHYLDLDYDLSRVMFVATANSTMGIPAPLEDRMEVIRLEGYTELEKLAIAQKYLVPKQLEGSGLGRDQVSFEEAALRTLVQRYTREAGVRNLEREIASVARKIARRHVKHRQQKRYRVTARQVPKFLGPHRFQASELEPTDEIGLTNGLAWTAAGGDILATEVSIMPGKGKLLTTGKLGDVMRESAQAAMSYIRCRAHLLGMDPNFYDNVDIHIHVPEGATPKDGPSAGITIATSLASALCQIPVKRTVAMTGELTLRGRVLPIGGLKEKLLAAHRAGIETVLIPKANEKDLPDVPKSVRDALAIQLVEHVDEVLREALVLEDPDAFHAKLAGATQRPPSPSGAAPAQH